MKNKRLEKKIQDVEDRLSLYRNAEKKILEGQSYSIGSRQLTRANLFDVQKKILELENELDALETKGTIKRKMYRVIPRD